MKRLAEWPNRVIWWANTLKGGYMVIIKAVFISENMRTRQTKFIGAGDSLVGKPRDAQPLTQEQAEAKITQMRRNGRFRQFEMTTEPAIIEEIK